MGAAIVRAARAPATVNPRRAVRRTLARAIRRRHPCRRTRMSATFEELDCQETELGELILRRRRPVSAPATWVYEVKLAGRFLMSSLVDVSERELARRALARTPASSPRVLVGGLGLGCTAATALQDRRVVQLDVVERLPAVIGWHHRRLVPLADTLVDDPRCRFVQADCLQLLAQDPTATYDLLLLDIDDSPRDLLDPAHAAFYAEAGLRAARRWLRPGGLLALWTNVPAEPALLARLGHAFARADVDEVAFDNPLLDARETNALYFAFA
jgi:spermidine synthase